MKLTIDAQVQQKLPELKICFETLPKPRSLQNPKLKTQLFTSTKLTKAELSQYRKFRRKIAGDELLATERLRAYPSPSSLPAPDPLTSSVIHASYYTGIPITIFPADTFDMVTLRFASTNDVLATNRGSLPIRAGALIADTNQGALGVFSIKSSVLGKVLPTTQRVTILSFGVSTPTYRKSCTLVQLVTRNISG